MESIDNDILKKEKHDNQREKFLDMFENEIASDLETIRVNIKRILNKSKDYFGFNYQDEAESFIHDTI